MKEELKSSEYDSFYFIKGNRGLSEGKVLDMIDAIKEKNLLREFPIVVTPKKAILDGQHRFEAAKRLGIPFYYIISDQIDIDDVAKVNLSIKKWQSIDFVNLYASRGKEDYIRLLQYKKNWGVSLDLVFRIFQLDSGDMAKVIKSGNFVFHVLREREGIRLYHMIYDFAKIYSRWTQRGFIYAFRTMIKDKNYDHKHMQHKMETMPRSFVRCVGKQQYLEMLVEIYNYRNKNRLEIKI